MKKLYSPLEVVDILGIHVKTVRRLLRDGTLKGVKIGGSWKISKEELETLVDHTIAETKQNIEEIMKGNEKVMKLLTVNVKVKNTIEGNSYAQALMKVINSNKYSNCKFKYDMNGNIAKFVLTGPTDYLNAMMSTIDEVEQSLSTS